MGAYTLNDSLFHDSFTTAAVTTTDGDNTIVPCSDMCGVVLESKSPLLKPGTRVMSIFLQRHMKGKVREEDMAYGLGFPLGGVLAEYRCFPAEALVVTPGYLTDEEASCLPVAAVTAWVAVNGMRSLGEAVGNSKSKKGKAGDGEGDGDGGNENTVETVLLQGTGAVSIAGLQIAHAAGLRTIITSKSDSKLTRAHTELGAHHTINYRTHWEWQDTVMEATSGRGADIILETGGAPETLRKSFASVAFGGVINCIGYMSGKGDGDDEGRGSGSGDAGGRNNDNGQLSRLNVNVLAIRRSVTLRGLINGGKDRFEEMLGFYEEHKIRPVVSRVFGMREAKEALGYLQSGEHFGKVVIKVAEE